MDHNLELFSKATDHLIYLTTYDPFGSKRSKGISNMSEFADELNSVGIVPKRGTWTHHSLECFFSRCRARYDKATLKNCADLRSVGLSSWEYQTGLRKPQSVKFQLGTAAPMSSTRLIKPQRYECIENENWKEFEETQLLREEAQIRKKANNLKLFTDFERIQRKAA